MSVIILHLSNGRLYKAASEQLVLRIMHPATLQTLFRDGLRNMTKNLGCCVGLQAPQILIWPTNHNLQDSEDLSRSKCC